jgi:hypothetical protein
MSSSLCVVAAAFSTGEATGSAQRTAVVRFFEPRRQGSKPLIYRVAQLIPGTDESRPP